MTDTLEINAANRQWKVKHHTRQLRERIFAMSAPGILELGPNDWKPCTAWFAHHNHSGRFYSVRNHNNSLFVFRLR